MTPRVKKSCGISMGSSTPRVVMRIVEHKVKDKTQKRRIRRKRRHPGILIAN